MYLALSVMVASAVLFAAVGAAPDIFFKLGFLKGLKVGKLVGKLAPDLLPVFAPVPVPYPKPSYGYGSYTYKG